MSQRFVRNPWFTDVVNTTDNTPTISAPCSYIIPSGAVGGCIFTVSARLTSGANSGKGGLVQITRPFQNIGGSFSFGPVALSIISVAAGFDVALVTTVVDFTADGTTQKVQPRVTGIAATNIEWLLDAAYWVN